MDTPLAAANVGSGRPSSGARRLATGQGRWARSRTLSGRPCQAATLLAYEPTFTSGDPDRSGLFAWGRLIVAQDFERYSRADLERRTGVKWHREGAAALAAWVADMDFPIASEIASAMTDLIGSGDLGYPDPGLDQSLRTAFARRAADRHDLLVDPGLVVVVSDVVQAIYLCLLAFTEPGEGVVFLTPSYPPFFSAVQETGRTPVTCELSLGPERFEVDLDRLREQVRVSRARLLLLCNPHNPTGRNFDRSELEGLYEIAETFDMVVVNDEIHADLTLRGSAHLPFGALGREAMARSVTLSSASKAFNLAGLRCAVAAFGSEQLRERFSQFPAHARGSVSVLGMVAALAAWEKGNAWLDGALQVLADHRDLVVSAAREHLGPSAMCCPQATYLAWLDMRSCRLPDEPAAWLREHARVALSPGADFGPSGSGHVRLNFATPRPVLVELLDRMWSALETRTVGDP